MENKIEQILKDLYLLDPSLKKDEAVLIQLIQKLIEIKPDIVVDQNFVNNLRSQLLSQISQMESYGKKHEAFYFGRWNYALGSMIAIVVVLAGVLYVNGPATFKSEIRDVANSGFGPLAVQDRSGMARPQSGGGGGGIGGGGGVATGMPVPSYDSKMIAPPYEVTKIVYQYAGEEFTQDNDTVPVLKRVIDESVVRSISRNVSKMGLGLTDLSRLNNALFTDMNISEQAEYGYNVSINLREGWLSFYQNWERWPQPAPCSDDISCQRISFIEESQIPDEQTLVRIADDFMNKYRINRSGYGSGMINKNWRNSFSQFPRSIETGTQLVGLDIPVIYPLLIDGKEVYDEWGGQIGIFVTINARTQKVTSAGNIGVQNYERSNYTAERDVKKILELAEKGGTNDMYYYDTPTKIITVKLGTPKMELVQTYKFNNAGGPSEILYVPSLVFPVQDISDRQYFQRENVVVPLASELLNQKLNPIQPPIQIMSQ